VAGGLNHPAARCRGGGTQRDLPFLCLNQMAKQSSVKSRVTPWTENGMQDVTDADPKSPGTKVTVSKVQGRSRPLDESSRTSLPILPLFN
jgi:hypothetical protein